MGDYLACEALNDHVAGRIQGPESSTQPDQLLEPPRPGSGLEVAVSDAEENQTDD